MRKLKYILFCFAVLVAVGIFLCLRPVQIYLMPINAWIRPVWEAPSATQREDNYVVYNHLWKSEQTLIDSVLAFCDRTISMDTIIKYADGYRCSFFKRTMTLNKSYKETVDGSDIINDHFDARLLSVRWNIEEDIVEIRTGGKRYEVPFTEVNFGIITSVSQLFSQEDFLIFEYQRPLTN